MKYHSKKSILILLLLGPMFSISQNMDILSKLKDVYPNIRESSLNERRTAHKDIQPLVEKWKKHPQFEVRTVGSSIEGRSISLISIGSGEKDVFLWSQMHGDEPTATMAIFDILNFLAADEFRAEKKDLLENTKLHFLPMLNPDGAERFQRRNLLGIDVNRDALRLQSPEAQILKSVRDSLEADFGFNLHDQSRYYNAEGTAKPATISFLAPAYDYDKSINKVRGAAMKIIVEMNRVLQKYIPGQVARYNDDFEPRAFGDNIQKWGTSTILIESGGNYDDPEKQEIRKLNFIAILSALFSISKESYNEVDIRDYQTIPQNDSKLFDLKLKGLEYDLLGNSYILDVGINHSEVSTNEERKFYYRGNIVDQGDLSTSFGYEEIDLSGYGVKCGKIYPKPLKNMQEIEKLDFSSLLLQGYSYIKVQDLPKEKVSANYPFLIVGEDFEKPDRLEVGSNPTFFLEKDGKIEFALINGFFIDLKDPSVEVKNGLIVK